MKGFCLCADTLKVFKEVVSNMVLTDKRYMVDISEWKDTGTSAQRRVWWVLMGSVAQWMRSKGIVNQLTVGTPSGNQTISTKQADKDFAHELVMYQLFPVNSDGKRKSLTEVMKDRQLMCETLERVFQYFAERGLILKLEEKDPFGYHKYLKEQER